MRKKISLILLLVAIAVLSLFAAACTTGVDVDAIIKDYPITVIIDYNGGKDGESEFKRIQCKMNSYLPKPGTVSFFSEPKRAGYEVGSYFKGTRDENGEPIFEKEWNFEKDKVTENMTLFVDWQREKSITIMYGEDNSQSYSFKIIESATSSNVFDRTDLEVVAPKWAGHTFYAYYFDEACTEEVTYPYNYSENPVEKLYTKYIEGTWKIVKSISDLTGITSSTNVWLDTDLDLSTYRNSNVFPASYSGEFNGNGHKISNYSFTKSTSRTNRYAGLFNTLASKAYIHDVEFADFTLTVTFGETIADVATNSVGLLAAEVEEGARIEDVKVSGTVQYDESTAKRPVVCNGVYGTYTGEGDFDKLYPTLTCQVKING